MARRSRVTIKDVARVACVTPQTVSRAFRDTHDISDETRERILKIADEMGYVKNTSASSLRYGESHLIAIVYDNLLNCYFSIMTDFLQRCLKESGYTTMAISVQDSYLKGEAYLSAIAHNVDGIISFLEPREEISSLVKKYNVPVLLFGRRTNVENVDYLRMDDVLSGRLAAKRLLSAGCKKLLYVSESLELTCAYDRYCGFRDELAENGRSFSLITNENWEGLKTSEKLLELYKSGEYPDGVFCFNDMIALETLYVIEKNSLPKIKIVGCDDIQSEIFIPGRLTTIGSDKMAMARKAVAMLLSRIEGDKEFCVEEKEPVFLVEGTTA